MWVTEGAGASQETMAPRKRRWNVMRILGAVFLLAFAFIFWGYTAQMTTPGGRAGLFAAASVCLLGALWPHHGAALILSSLMALGIAETVQTLNGWNVTAMLLGSLGAFLACRRSLPLAWVSSSFPFWGMSGAMHGLVAVALALIFIGLGTSVALPYRVGKRAAGAEPLAHLAHGPVSPVPERIFRHKSGKRLLLFALPLCGCAVILGGILWFTGSRAGGLSLVLSGTILGVSLTLFTWLGSRMHYRVDPQGIHTRIFLREKSIPWTRVCDLFLRYQFMPGLGQSWVYYCILSPGCVIAFPHTLVSASELRDIIEHAAGMRWPEPGINPS
jgi:hypothetical protein